jgi:hypothetical protein
MELVPATESEKNVREEVNRRTWRAGYTDRDGQMMDPKIVTRPSRLYSENYERAFGHK